MRSNGLIMHWVLVDAELQLLLDIHPGLATVLHAQRMPTLQCQHSCSNPGVSYQCVCILSERRTRNAKWHSTFACILTISISVFVFKPQCMLFRFSAHAHQIKNCGRFFLRAAQQTRNGIRFFKPTGRMRLRTRSTGSTIICDYNPHRSTPPPSLQPRQREGKTPDARNATEKIYQAEHPYSKLNARSQAGDTERRES